MTMTETKTDISAALPAWSIHWRGQVFRESDLKGRHLSILSMLVGNDGFDTLDVNPTLGHQRLMMVITAFLAAEATEGLDDQEAAATAVVEAVKLVADAPAEEILGAIRFE